LSLGWADVRRQFDLDPDLVHLGSSQFIASHPRPVRAAIERHRRRLDADPVGAMKENDDRMQAVRAAAAKYLGTNDPDEIALTDSTTLGLGLLYNGLPSEPGTDWLTTDHEHYSQLQALRNACRRNGTLLRQVKLYDGLAAETSPRGLVDRVMEAVRPSTRVVAMTWVHSDTGLKMPIRALARALASEAPETILCVDGTHGFGVENETVADLGCDFFAGDTHKWMYGPRGTGFVWGRAERWREVQPAVASFTDLMDAFAEGEPKDAPMTGRRFTPGGFHSVEHRWAATEAFAFHRRIGRSRIAKRVHELNRRCKRGLADLADVTVHTPRTSALSAGITAFEVRGNDHKELEARLRKEGIVATVAPYPSGLLRFTPGIYNTVEEVDRGVLAIAAATAGHRRVRTVKATTECAV
jgi:isopenicillin-N epimerase